MRTLIISGVVLIVFVFSCRQDEGGADQPKPKPPVDTTVVLTPVELQPPAHFPEMIIPEDNQPYLERIQLGRMLYYDPILSNDGRFCAGCHHQDKGFTINTMVGGTPVLPHVNLGWSRNFMWNGSEVGTLEDVMHFEVAEFFGTDLQKVNNDTMYRRLFRKHFGVEYVSYKELSYALAQFVRTMISRDSKYDRYITGKEELDYNQMAGRNLFFSEKGDCFHCHINPVMTDNQLHNTGLDSLYLKEADKGLYNVTGKATDLGKFRTPNLRNVALRENYMHDGRYQTLEEVVEFYNSGVRKVANLDPIMTKPGKENGLNLTPLEKFQLVEFLKTLTDQSFITDTTLSRPN